MSSGGIRSLIGQFEQKQKDLLVGDQRKQQGFQATRASRTRLNTAPLIAAGLDKSKNPLLQALWDAVKEYNQHWKHPTTMTDMDFSHAITELDYIYQSCAQYMTDKNYKTTKATGAVARRKERYEAFEKLIQDVVKELELFGGRALVGPANFRDNRRNYWLERVDPHNRAGYMISSKYNDWLNSGRQISFWDWLNTNGGYTISRSTHVNGYRNPRNAQWEHCKYFNGDLLLNATDDRPFSTATLKTEFSGTGWAVFVCSLPMMNLNGDFGNWIFSYTHHAGWDHHSSFLGGAPVMAAGEWIVDTTGRIKVITAKSGHYMPKWENLHRFVSRFREIPGDAIIRPNMLDHNNGADTIKYYTVQDFRSTYLNAQPLPRSVVLSKIRPANSNIDEHFVGGVKKLADLLPPG